MNGRVRSDVYRRYGYLAGLLTIALLILISLVGCGGGQSASGPQGGAPDRRAFEGETLTLVLKEGYEIEAIQEYKEDFEKATGTTVEIEVYDEPTARQKFILDSTSKTGAYDITSVSFWHLPEYQRAGYLEPLDQWVSKARDPWLDPEAIPGTAMDVMSVDGELYALPHTIISGMLFYRDDLFQQHGIKPPQTSADVLSAAKELKGTEPSISPFTGRGAPTFASLGTWLGWTWGYGAALYDDNMCPQATDPKFVQGMSDLMTLMQDYGPEDAASLTFTQAGEKFSGGNAAMMFDTTGFGGIFEDPELSQVAGKVGYSLPEGPAGNPMQWTYLEGLGISAYSDNKELAWLFLQWRMSDETTRKEALELGRFDVPNLNVLESDAYAKAAKEKKISDYTQKLPQSWENITLDHWPFVPEFSRIGDTFMQQVSSAIAGGQSAEEAMQAVQPKLEAISKDAGYCK
ncbi:MAG: sugar ABC transporter substrate-binding protein [Actinomycetota bacterium]|nr:sugar ABC transporter substrate-binding protein [Actinomycetota bacterium]